MKRAFLMILLCAAAAARASALDFAGFVSSWKQDCTDGCALPVPGDAEAETFKLDLPLAPGEVHLAKFDKTFAFASGEKIQAAFTVYFVCPRDAAARPGADSCPTRYVQVQAVLTGDARAFCAASLNPADANPFPVMVCAGENVRAAGERLGVSLSRKDLKAAAAAEAP